MPRRIRHCLPLFRKTPPSRGFCRMKKGNRMPNPLYRQHVISISDLTTEQLELLLQTALKLKEHPRDDLLEGKLIGSCFSNPPPARACRLKPPYNAWAAKSSALPTAPTPVRKKAKPSPTLPASSPATPTPSSNATPKTAPRAYPPSFPKSPSSTPATAPTNTPAKPCSTSLPSTKPKVV